MSKRASLLASTVADEEDNDWHHFVDWEIPAFKDIASMAYTACLSGPVDVQKKRKWHGLEGVFSIADKFEEAGYPKSITNAKWKKFCKAVSHNIDCSLFDVRESYTFERYGKLWPACDAEYVSNVLSGIIKNIEIMHYGATSFSFSDDVGYWDY